MPLNEIAMRVASLTPSEHRLNRSTLPNGIVVLDDAYNTNPVGAISALQALSMYSVRKVLITPGMVELGPLQDEENKKLGEAAAKYCTDIVLVGVEQTKPIVEGVKSTDFDLERLMVMDTVQEAIEWYQRELKSGDAILFLNDLSDNYL
jgi:UDP-N-acetylmuramoyl-tripeptide--D-alanyl-D-alanine ligase